MAMKIFCWRAKSPIEGRTEPMEAKIAAAWLETLRRTSPGFECWLEDAPENEPVVQLSASDVQDALDAMIAAKRALEAAYAKPVLIVDLMRVIDRLEAYQQGNHKCGQQVKPEAQCPHCKAGMPMSAHPKRHWTGNANPPECTAPEGRESAEDTARLDWLEAESSHGELHLRDFGKCMERGRTILSEAATLREAIDAARGVK